MKPYKANLLNAIILIVIGLWSYLGSESPSLTALIPVVAGGLLLTMVPAMKNGNRVVAHIVVGLTFVLIIAFIKPLTGVLERGDMAGLFRVAIMVLSSLFALAVFIKSFIDARMK
jgi:ABC-type sulfate transport system permease subunit